MKAPVTKAKEPKTDSLGRINRPLNVNVWRDLPEEHQALLTWFHQHCLDQAMNWDQAAEALGYDRSTVYRVLSGTYAGSWENVCQRIASYQRIAVDRLHTQHARFVETPVTKMVWAALDYGIANQCGVQIEGQSRVGKTSAVVAWRDRHNHGRSVYVMAPPYGGTKAFLRELAHACGVGRDRSISQIVEALYRSFNSHRIIIVDEAHRLLPNDRRSNPVNLEIIRDIHDRTGCAFALIATSHFNHRLQSMEYMFEQLLGRIELPVRLPRRLRPADIEPIIEQFIEPTPTVMDTAVRIANERGRLGVLVSTLRVASRIACGNKHRMTEQHFLKAVKIRNTMMGGINAHE